MSKRLYALLIAAAVLVVAVTGWGVWSMQHREKPQPPAASVPVQLHADVPKDTSIALILTLSSDPGQGSKWRDAAAGAEVAIHRFAMSGTKISLTVFDDHGTASGSAEAVAKARKARVSGIVYASTGDHLLAGVKAAAHSGTPVLLPYYSDVASLPTGAWSTGPSDEDIAAVMANLITQQKLDPLLTINAGGKIPQGIEGARMLPLDPKIDRSVSAKVLSKTLGRSKPQGIVAAGPALTLGQTVALIQGVGSHVPVVLTPEALSPGFYQGLVKANGTASTELFSVGAASGDAQSLGTDEAARSMSAYLAGLRLLAADPGAKNPVGDDSFSTVAAVADSRSHDAVVALVRAVEKAQVKDSGAVSASLANMTVGYDQGITGSPLDFTRPAAFPKDRVVPLSSGQDTLGLRPAPASGVAPLVWFPARP